MDAGGMTNPKDEARRLLGAGQAPEAIALLQASAGENDAEAQSLLGAALGMAGDNAGSVARLERATQLDPQQPSYQFNLGCALEKAGEQGRAVAAYQAALQSNPGYTKAREALDRLGVPAAGLTALAAPDAFPQFGAPAAPLAGPAPAGVSPAPAPGFQPGVQPGPQPGFQPGFESGAPPLSGPTLVAPGGQPQGAMPPGFQPYGAQPYGTPSYGLSASMVQPPIISSVRFWYMFQIIITGLAVAFGLYSVTQAPVVGARPLVGSVMVVYYAIAMLILIAAYILAGKRTSTGYYMVLVLSFLGLLAFPLGTIVSIYILTKWFKPELKAWYGVS